MKVMSQPLIFR